MPIGTGSSKRPTLEYFAGHALAGLAAGDPQSCRLAPKLMGSIAWRLAEAMIETWDPNKRLP